MGKEAAAVKDKISEIEEYCAVCEHAAPLHDEGHVLCEKKGVVASDFLCRKFAYDPLKRKVSKAPAPKLEYIDIDS